MSRGKTKEEAVVYYPGYRSSEGIIYEAVKIGGWDAPLVFLAYDPQGNKFFITNEIPRAEDVVRPFPNTKRKLYKEYILDRIPTTADIPTTKQLYDEVYAEFKNFVDADDWFLHVGTAAALQSYHQDKAETEPIITGHGLPESGKSRFQELLSWLAYRTFYNQASNAPDIYRAIDIFQPSAAGGNPCMWCEDEISHTETHRDRKMTCYKQGTKRGSTVNRVDSTDGIMTLRGYDVFCLKCLTGVQSIEDEQLTSRSINYGFVSGSPPQNLNEVLNENPNYFYPLRNKLLIWRIAQVVTKQSFNRAQKAMNPSDPRYHVQLAYDVLTNRILDVWDPLLKMAYETAGEQILSNASFLDYGGKARERYNSLDGEIARCLSSSYLNPLQNDPKHTIPFNIIYAYVTSSPHEIVHKPSQKEVAMHLRDAFCGTRVRVNNEVHYKFDPVKLARIINRYMIWERMEKYKEFNPP